MHPRRTARESILGALYAYELTGEEKNKVLLDAFERNSFDEETKIYISNLYDNILENKTWAENLISDNLDNWKLERVATLDQLIMRIAISEIYFNEDIPPKVSISEAIEIAKIYSTEDSSGFVNGVLDSIYQRKIVSD
ncbi:MAG: transcription antitermination factor NusB [Candidatus Neomarinimicrobiota bacterium]|jgi:N utilization substance protein B|nr:transcription antitermination factor NusB [Candidatus Neomarinimicrobiota bacterium]|tara:strand:+ start:1558 stop:1971 length:414 start_codon:yes stop_codon:yes gene_type:complete